MSQIHQIEPSRVVHELILKPIGTYLIRYSTENDDIISRMNTEKEIKSNPYVVLSVRVDENKYHCSIMNYHLPFEEENSRYTIEYYRNNFKDDKLPELIEECIIKTDETDWKINHEYITQGYLQMFDSNDKYLKTEMQCDTLDENNTINVLKKAIKNNEEELNILKTISYFHIVTFYGITNELNQMKYLVLADNGESLKTKYPDIKLFGDLTSKQLAAIGYQIACGMMYLELKHIIHRDLHADNIFIDDYNFIRIGDFGHAIIKDDDQEFNENRDLKFKIRRLAPECLPSLPDNGELFDSNEILFSEFSSKSDVWSYGLIFIDLTIYTYESIYPELLVLSSHNDAKETIQIIEHVKINQRIHKRPDDCPENLYNILKRCWEYDRDKRISFENLRNQMLILFKSIHK